MWGKVEKGVYTQLTTVWFIGIIAYLFTILHLLVAGNLTLAGSAANIIVAEKAARHKTASLRTDIDSWAHFKICGGITILTIVFGILVIYIECKGLGYINWILIPNHHSLSIW